ncbi:arginine--tRNA ligase [Microcella alkalica]|uniref:Arginine--tRNA ligase n=1 Tax=Microcella alkalica TaxID=355930 RepID=A0A839EAJ3_9MICO|nr:arginyl-tRNA synthetase [Microcella alkalica]
MNPDLLASSLLAAVTAAVQGRDGEAADSLSVGDIALERPRNRDHGDWATSVALKLAKRIGLTPRALAEELATAFGAIEGVASVEVAGPGFLNIRLEAGAAGALAAAIVAMGGAYGGNDALAGQSINLEFVSANPTGPIHLGGTRWAAVGDSLARLLSISGAAVIREYYFNDHGVQIDRFARSLVAAYRGEPTPEDGYGGQYISDIADRVVATRSNLGSLDGAELQEAFRASGVNLMFDDIKKSLSDFGVHFDVYFHENNLHESGAVDRAISRLRELGHIFEEDGAVWLRTTAFGDDKDRVVVKSNGEAAYISGDLAYYLDKRERGFDRCIIMLGADHHGYVQRMMAMCAAFGDTPNENLQILIGQMVNLVQSGKPVRMSKRAGTVVTMEDLVDAVGVDAARYALVRSSSDSNLDIDLDVLQKRSNDNPVFYVQYAHARTHQVARNADAAGVDGSQFAAELLTDETESILLGALAEFPRIVAQAASLREPHRVARFLEELAAAFHRWYDACRVTPVGDDPVQPVHHSRRVLADATGQVLRNGLDLLGVSAPERM